MRISDWSSDVCSSDLHVAPAGTVRNVEFVSILNHWPAAPRARPRTGRKIHLATVRRLTRPPRVATAPRNRSALGAVSLQWSPAPGGVEFCIVEAEGNGGHAVTRSGPRAYLHPPRHHPVPPRQSAQSHPGPPAH